VSVRARSIAALLALLACLLATPRPARANAYYDQLRAARGELARGNLAAAKTGFLAADSAAYGLPSAVWSLAQIASRERNAAETLRLLAEYAAMGLARRAYDTTFAWIYDDPRLAPVTRILLANAEPRALATVGVRLNDAGLLAEDLAYDARTRTFYVSSIHRRKVIAIDAGGAIRDFIAPAQEGVWGIYGLALDSARGSLWGSMAAVPTMEHYDPADSGRTALVCWELATGKELLRAELPRDGASHVFGDITLAPDGTVYATDSVGGGLYRLQPGGKKLETLAPPGTFASPQMEVLMRKGREIWISDYPRGIVAFDVRTGAVSPVSKPRSLAASGIDGLYAANGHLVAIQNGTQPARVLWISVDAGRRAMTSWAVLEQDPAELGDPNHGVVVGDVLYFLGNSGWDRVNASDQLETPEGAKPPAILRLNLPSGSGRR
jgi:sugar lactone lactonase YvrE